MARKTTHRTCQHASGPVKMQRLYVRRALRFVPVGWMCPDCHQFVNDEIRQSPKP